MNAVARTARCLCAAALASLVITGCAVGPNYKRPAIEAPAQYKEQVSMAATAEPPRDWWTLFGDDTLNDLEHQVEVSNQNLAASEAAYRQAAAVIREQRAALLPTIDIGAGTTRTGGQGRTNFSSSAPGSTPGVVTSRPAQTYEASASAGWEIDLWGRLRRALESARALGAASADDLAAAKLSLQSQLATVYLQLRETDAEGKLLADTVTAFERSLQIAQNRYNVGMAAKTDVLQAQTQLANAQDQAAALTLQRAQFEHAIASLVGKAAGDFSLPARDAWQTSVPEVPAGIPSTLLQRRPDIAAAERRVAAANANIGVEEAAYFPSLTLSGSYEFLAISVGALFKTASSTHSASASIAESIFNGGATSARVAGARAAYDQTVAEYRQSVLTAFQDVEDQLAASTWLARQYEFRRQASEAADETERLSLNQYRAGTVGYTNVIVAQTAALSARRSLAEIALTRQTSAISLIAALGGGWNSVELPR
jgi:NodT family efflux transporter outer membrane factor (OMF) lipoprotein